MSFDIFIWMELCLLFVVLLGLMARLELAGMRGCR